MRLMQNHQKADVSIDSIIESPITKNVHSHAVKTALDEVLDIQSKLRMSIDQLISIIERSERLD